MKRKISLLGLVVLALAFGWAMPAQAVTIDFVAGTYLDTGNVTRNWSDVSNQHSVTGSVGGVGFTMAAYNGSWISEGSAYMYTVNEDAVLNWSQWNDRPGSGGIGIGEVNPSAVEIDQTEILHMTFDQPVELTSFTLQLFYHEGYNSQQDGYYETAWYYALGNFYYMQADADIYGAGSYNQLGQFFEFPALSGPITEIYFTAGSGVNAGSVPNTVEFNLAAMNVIPGEGGPEVPEPATMLLLGSGLAGVMIRRRRNRR